MKTSDILFNLGKEHLIRILIELDSQDLRELFANGLRYVDDSNVLHVMVGDKYDH